VRAQKWDPRSGTLIFDSDGNPVYETVSILPTATAQALFAEGAVDGGAGISERASVVMKRARRTGCRAWP